MGKATKSPTESCPQPTIPSAEHPTRRGEVIDTALHCNRHVSTSPAAVRRMRLHGVIPAGVALLTLLVPSLPYLLPISASLSGAEGGREGARRSPENHTTSQ